MLYFIADETNAAAKLAGQIRAELGSRLELIDNSEFKCALSLTLNVRN